MNSGFRQSVQNLPFDSASQEKREMRNTCLVFFLLLLFAVSADAQMQSVFDIQVDGSIAEVPVTLAARYSPHSIELRKVDKGASPILNLVDSRGTGVTVKTVKTKGDRAAINVPATTNGEFTLIVRSRSYGVFRADVWINNELVTKGVVFSHGTSVSLPRFGAGERAVAVSPPGGLASHNAYLASEDGLHILQRWSGGQTTLPGRESGSYVGLYGSTVFGKKGRLTIYRNDPMNDADGDGLGNRLEVAIKTCASRASLVTGVSCQAIADTRDTDGDGLWDAWELMGKGPALPLPTWGANPRHKDIFVEVDFRRLTLQDNENGLAERMPPIVARQVADVYGDRATTDPALRAAHAMDVGNPDGEPGISLHFDTGVAPQTAADATIYGDWGGYTAVNAVPDGAGGYRPQTPHEAMVNNLTDSRRGIFHYVLGYMSGGGACGVGIACGFNMASASNSAHEFGHTLFLDHNGPAGTHEPNCKPNYPSLINYAFPAGMFSDGRGFPALNNHALIETGVAASQPALLNVLRSMFGYRVDATTGSVDWNRDGIFQPVNQPVRAYANLQPGNGGGCEFTREGEVPVGTTSRRAPAVVRHNGLIWVFTVTLDHKLEYSYMASPWTCQNVDNCPPPTFPHHVVRDIGPIDSLDAATINVNGQWLIIVVGIRPDGSLFEVWQRMSDWQVIWGSEVTVPGSPAAGEPSLAVSRDGKRVALAYKGTDGILRYRTRGPASWGPEQLVTVGGLSLTMNEVSSPGIAYTGLPIGVVGGQEHLVGAFATADGSFKLYTLRTGFFQPGWTRLPIPHDNLPLVVGRPSMAWTASEPGNNLAERSVGGSVNVGRFYLVYPSFRSTEEMQTSKNPVRMAMSYIDDEGVFRIGLVSYFDNYWSYAFGIDLLQPGELGLRAAEVYSIPNAFGMVKFRPHADGISNLLYKNYNDWPVLAWGSCRVLADSQDPSMQVSCPPKPW